MYPVTVGHIVYFLTDFDKKIGPQYCTCCIIMRKSVSMKLLKNTRTFKTVFEFAWDTYANYQELRNRNVMCKKQFKKGRIKL